MPTLAEVKNAEQAAEDATARAKHLRALLQWECAHVDVIEAQHAEYTWLPPQPPFRVCLTCGFAEAGWGVGYKVLTTAPSQTQVTRKDAVALTIGRVHDNDLFLGNVRETLREVLGLNETPSPDTTKP